MLFYTTTTDLASRCFFRVDPSESTSEEAFRVRAAFSGFLSDPDGPHAGPDMATTRTLGCGER
jgi:hypothetical protein